MEPDQAVIDRWSGAAAYWEKHRDVIRQMFGPVTHGLVEAAGIGGRDAVLDVATGPGEPALGVAGMAGFEGTVVGVDPIPGMVAAARAAASRSGLTNAQFEVAFADALPFPSDHFDAIVSRFGVMFFPSPVDGIREMLRVLKPGGRLALAVWGLADNNSFFYAMAGVIDRYVEPPQLDPDAPDAFRFAKSGKLLEVMREAGVTGLSERVLQFPIEAPVSIEDFWTLRLEMSEKLRERLATLSSEQLSEAKREALEAFRPYAAAGGLSFPSEALIVSGMKRG